MLIEFKFDSIKEHPQFHNFAILLSDLQPQNLQMIVVHVSASIVSKIITHNGNQLKLIKVSQTKPKN